MEIPSEMVAALIFTFVGGVNMRVACHWFAEMSDRTAENILADQQGFERTTAGMLFSTVLLMHDSQVANQIRARYASKLATYMKLPERL